MPPRKSTHRSPARFVARILPGAAIVEFPGFVEPAAVADGTRPRGTPWLHEVQHPGLRMQLHLLDGLPHLYTRNGVDAAHELSALAQAARDLPANKLILDGLLTADSVTAPPRYLAFDLLYLDGFDIREAPLKDRKRVLAMLLDEAASVIAALAYANEPSRLTRAKNATFVAKNAEEPYRAGSASGWIAWRAAR